MRTITTEIIRSAPSAVAAPRVERNQCALAAAWTADLDAHAAAGLLSTRTAKVYRDHAVAWLAWLDRESVEVPTAADVLRYVAALRVGHSPILSGMPPSWPLKI